MTAQQVIRSLWTIAALAGLTLFSAEAGPAVAQASDATASSAEEDVVDTFQKEAEQVGNKASELGEGIGAAADSVADDVSTGAENAYRWSKKKGEEAYEWSRKQLHDLTN